MKDRYLFVVAHPDDEILGAGATILRLVSKGCFVAVCVLSCQCNTRTDDIKSAMLGTHLELGISMTTVGEFGCLRFKDEDHHAMVSFIEKAICKAEPTVVVTHHPSDLNNDHYIASICCQEAVRLPQRQIGYSKRISKFMFMEVPSETDFALNSAWGRFTPNYYCKVKAHDIKKKISLLKEYDNVVRNISHPRSEANIKALSVVRGAECGYKHAEAFQTVFQLGGV
jgi:LmbE family N-acetylglucosaminyl deacetylase